MSLLGQTITEFHPTAGDVEVPLEDRKGELPTTLLGIGLPSSLPSAVSVGHPAAAASLKVKPVKPLCDILQGEGAAGQAVPYLGCVEMTVTFPREFLGADFDVATLVVPDGRSDFQCPVLIGMNTLEPLYSQYMDSEVAEFQPAAHGYKAMLKLLRMRHRQQQAGNDGVVRLATKSPVLIPARHTTVVKGSVHSSTAAPGQWALVEHPASPLPGGLCVKNSLITLPSQGHMKKIPVVLTNDSDHDVTIPPLCVIAELAISPQILSHQVSPNHLSSETLNTLKLDFGESLIPPEWKERIISKLTEIPEFFSHHDLDFGCTNKVKHRIKLHDETPFKHRARPIHPRDVEAVCQHLCDLLEAGFIRESDSPFSSPIAMVRKKNRDIWLCIDYHKMNLQTIKDVYALPNLEESFLASPGSKWFSVLT